MYSRMSCAATSGRMPTGAQQGRMRFMRPKRASSANMMRSRRPRRAAARRALLTASGKRFFKCILRREVALGMKRTRHELAPAVPVQEVIDRAVAGFVSDRFLIGRFEIMDVQHLASAGGFGKTRQQCLFFGQRHVLVLASAVWLGLERPDATLVIGHVRTVHRTQRHAHRSRNRRLRHPTLTQQHHLDALPLRGRYFPAQRSSQPPHLGFAAFAHLFPSNQMAPANHTSARKTAHDYRSKVSIQAVMEGVLDRIEAGSDPIISSSVMPALVAGIHVFLEAGSARKSWMDGIS